MNLHHRIFTDLVIDQFRLYLLYPTYYIRLATSMTVEEVRVSDLFLNIEQHLGETRVTIVATGEQDDVDAL